MSVWTNEMKSAAMQDAATVRKQHDRIEELEVAVRAALSFAQERHADHSDGHAQMVIAALRGALRNSTTAYDGELNAFDGFRR